MQGRGANTYQEGSNTEIPAPAWEALEPHISGAGSTWTRLPLCWVLPAPMGAPAPCAGCCSHGRMSIWWYRWSANESTNRRFQRLIGQPNVCAAPREREQPRLRPAQPSRARLQAQQWESFVRKWSCLVGELPSQLKSEGDKSSLNLPKTWNISNEQLMWGKGVLRM